MGGLVLSRNRRKGMKAGVEVDGGRGGGVTGKEFAGVNDGRDSQSSAPTILLLPKHSEP